jgi:hypothetical protein
MPAQRRRPYQDELTKVSEREMREGLGDAWRSATSVTLTIGDTVTEVALLDLPCAQTFGGTKRWLRCPSCARKVMTVAAFGTSWSCAVCGRWAWRDRSRLLRERQRGDGTPANQESHDTEPPCAT